MSGIPSWAVPGAKVVCVDAQKTDRMGLERVLVAGAKYVIEWVGFCENTPSTRLIGVKRDIRLFDPVWLDYPFRLSRFKPLTTTTLEQDIAIFKKIADEAPADMEPVQ